MILSIKEAIQRVQSLYSKGVKSTDSRLSSRHIYSVLQTARSKVIKQIYNKNQSVSQWVYQTMSCIELQKAAIHECPCVPANNCEILRSKFKIPKPITGIDKHLIQSVTTLDGNTVFSPTTFDTQKYNSGNKFTSSSSNYYIRNEYLYLTSLKELKAITITGLFDDPLEAVQFPSLCPCTDCNCKDITDYNFPVDRDTFATILDFVYKELIVMFPQMSEDKNNNASDDNSIKGMVHSGQDQ